MNLDIEFLYHDMMKYITYFKAKYPSIPLDDLEDELRWSFFKTYRVFDESKGVLFKTLFFNIANNGCKCILRYRSNRKGLIDAKSLDYINDQGDTFSEYYDYMIVTNNGDEDRLLSINILESLAKFTETLPQSQKKVMELYLAGYSNGEISTMLNLQHNNVSTQKASVLKKFVKQYKDEFPMLREHRTSRNIINRLEK